MIQRLSRSISVIIIAISVLLSLFSCSPVEFENIEKEEIGIAPDSSAVSSATNDGRSMHIVFHPVEGARSYALSVRGSDPAGIQPELKGGIYEVDIQIPQSRASEESVECVLYASASLLSDDDISWSEIQRFKAVYERTPIDSVAPEYRIISREKDSVSIEIVNAPEAGMEYLASFPDGRSEEYHTERISISGLEPDKSYTVTLSHRYQDGSWGTLTSTIEIGTYEGEALLDIRAEGKDIVVSNIPEGTERIELLKAGSGRIAASALLDGRTSSHTFRAEEAFPVFDAGEFRARAIGGGSTVISGNTISYVSPIPSDAVRRTGRQHYSISFTIAEDADFTVSSSIGTVETSIDGNTARIVLKGFESLRDYNGRLDISSGNATSSTELSFRTASFAGSYSYRDPGASGNKDMKEFSVSVVENETAGSVYKYHIYSDEGESHRIMPLIDPAVDGDIPGTIPYEGGNPYQEAYAWNNSKWNSSNATVNNWSIKDSTVQEDSFSTVVTSNATMKLPIIGPIKTDAETTTEFVFTEDEEFNVHLAFFNKITGGGTGATVGNSYLRKNRIWKEQGVADEYTFLLEEMI